jgi:hypothetical protein
MKWIDGLCVFALSFGIVFCAACYANAEVGFVSNPLWLSSSHVTEGVTVQASTVITKRDLEKVDGTVTFYADGKAIGTSDFSLPSNVGGVVVAVSWVPEKGTQTVSAKVTRAVAGDSQDLNVAEEVKAEEKLTVDPDNDRDGVADAKDEDDDNDGVTDAEETKNGSDPKSKETSAAPTVAGASTTASGLVEQAKDLAGPVGETVVETTESWREKGKDYFDGKVAGTGNTKGFASTTNKDLVNNPKEGVMGIWEMAMAYGYKAGAFIFGNVYAFYIFFIVLILWLLRKIWRRYSLD